MDRSATARQWPVVSAHGVKGTALAGDETHRTTPGVPPTGGGAGDKEVKQQTRAFRLASFCAEVQWSP